MISIEQVVQVVVYIIVVAAIFGLLWWLIGYAGIPEPFNKFARVFLAVCAVLILIGILLSLIGHPIVRWTDAKLPHSGFVRSGDDGVPRVGDARGSESLR